MEEEIETMFDDFYTVINGYMIIQCFKEIKF